MMPEECETEYGKSYMKHHFVKLIASALRKTPRTSIMGIRTLQKCPRCVYIRIGTQVKVSIYLRSFEEKKVIYIKILFRSGKQGNKRKGYFWGLICVCGFHTVTTR